MICLNLTSYFTINYLLFLSFGVDFVDTDYSKFHKMVRVSAVRPRGGVSSPIHSKAEIFAESQCADNRTIIVRSLMVVLFEILEMLYMPRFWPHLSFMVFPARNQSSNYAGCRVTPQCRIVCSSLSYPRIFQSCYKCRCINMNLRHVILKGSFVDVIDWPRDGSPQQLHYTPIACTSCLCRDLCQNDTIGTTAALIVASPLQLNVQQLLSIGLIPHSTTQFYIPESSPA